jgi:hypothetical protein
MHATVFNLATLVAQLEHLPPDPTRDRAWLSDRAAWPEQFETEPIPLRVQLIKSSADCVEPRTGWGIFNDCSRINRIASTIVIAHPMILAQRPQQQLRPIGKDGDKSRKISAKPR